MHITGNEIRQHLERRARKMFPEYAQMAFGEQQAGMLGIAQVIIWDLIMDLDPDVRVKRIKEMKK